MIAEAFALLGIPVVGAADAEADDIIGTFASTWDGPVDIVTGDRDLFQLVDDARGVRVLYVARGVSKHDVVDNAWIRAKYGIDASQYVDFAVMRGDASDGLPGVAGIGDKTAAVLLKEFGDIDGILEAAQDRWSSIKPRVRQSLLDSVDYIAAARTVVAVKRDACDFEVLTAPVQEEAFRTFGETWGLGGATDRALKALAETEPRLSLSKDVLSTSSRTESAGDAGVGHDAAAEQVERLAGGVPQRPRAGGIGDLRHDVDQLLHGAYEVTRGQVHLAQHVVE